MCNRRVRESSITRSLETTSCNGWWRYFNRITCKEQCEPSRWEKTSVPLLWEGKPNRWLNWSSGARPDRSWQRFRSFSRISSVPQWIDWWERRRKYSRQWISNRSGPVYVHDASSPPDNRPWPEMRTCKDRSMGALSADSLSHSSRSHFERRCPHSIVGSKARWSERSGQRNWPVRERI